MKKPPRIARTPKSGKRNQDQEEEKATKHPRLTEYVIERDPNIPQALHQDMGKRLVFRPYNCSLDIRPPRPRDRGYFFRMIGSESRLIRWTFEDNGFRETRKQFDWNVLWATGCLRSQIYQGLSRIQKVNHFPRSHEICKKDALYRNLARMSVLHGKRHFAFIPETYILPQETDQLQAAMDARKQAWIIKPVGSSQGKGIFMTSRMAEIPRGIPLVACKYIDNPLLINDLKFDLRIYVGITSINPLRIYIYEEGLARFATQKYESIYSSNTKNNRFMHLTNYSINKHSSQFKDNVDVEADSEGSKWSLKALREFLRENHINDFELWDKIKDIVVKTIISMESTVTAGFEMFVPYRDSCFELLGFDILIDQDINPWLLEVNLSPSLNCDSPIDLSIKSNLITDLLNLAGVKAHVRPQRCMTMTRDRPHWQNFQSNLENENSNLSLEETRVIKSMDAEMRRLGKFERLYPTTNSNVYKNFFDEDRPLNTLWISHLTGNVRKGIKSSNIRQLPKAVFRNNTSIRHGSQPRSKRQNPRKLTGDRFDQNFRFMQF